MRRIHVVAAMAVAAPMLAACATKGYVREQVDAERVDRVAADSTIRGEVATTRGEVQQLRTDIEALRRDLTALRDEFGARITAMEEGVRFAFPVHFAFDEASVRMEDEAALTRFASVVQQYYPGSKITVEGFADPAGSRAYNDRLSQQRAESVREFLVGRGLADNLLYAVGYGENRLVVPGAQRDDPGAEQNRRVVFVVESRGDMMETVAALSGR